MMTEPEYYTKGDMSPLQAFKKGLLTREEYVGFLKGNIIKYVIRCERKGDFEKDLHKAETYMIELYYLLGSESRGMSMDGFKQMLMRNKDND